MTTGILRKSGGCEPRAAGPPCPPAQHGCLLQGKLAPSWLLHLIVTRLQWRWIGAQVAGSANTAAPRHGTATPGKAAAAPQQTGALLRRTLTYCQIRTHDWTECWSRTVPVVQGQNHGHIILGKAAPILQHRAYGTQIVSLWCCKQK